MTLSGELGQALIVGCSAHFLLWCNSKCCYSFQPSPFHILHKYLPGSINRASTLNVLLTIDILATLQNINPILGKKCFKLKLLNPNSMVSDMSIDIPWVVCGVVWVRRWGLRRDLVEGGRGTKHFPTKMPPGSDQSWSWSRRNTRLRDKRKHLLWDIRHIKLSQGLHRNLSWWINHYSFRNKLVWCWELWWAQLLL